MTILTQGQTDLEFLVSEASGHRSRAAVTVDASGGALEAGTILGKRNTASATAAVVVGASAGGGTGDGVMTLAADPVLSDAIVGVYTVTFISEATNAGGFIVRDPNGVDIGEGAVGVAFANQVAFTIADGSADFDIGDQFSITVAAGDGDYIQYDATATNGAEIVAGVLGYGIGAVEDIRTIIARDAEVAKSELIYPTGANDAAKLVADAGLAALGIIVRT
jgi:hypothetical protein